MRLEDEIKQKKFKSEHHKLVVNILFTHNWLVAKHSGLLKPYGVTLQQYNILRILRGQYPTPVTINLLISRMLDKMSNASRLVEKLRTKGLLERKVNTIDRRSVDVVITKKGLDLLEALNEMDDNLKQMQILSDDEAIEINRLLDKMRQKAMPRLPVMPV
ncbi:MAG: MarR family transcriptional regulator [Bacteroidia bacterium]|nr:MarR family transcriptional regulator [Bacteroidia bacterium]